MNISVEKIDELRERKDVSYEEAKDALEHSDGDLLDAIIYLEEKENKKQNQNNNQASFEFQNDEFEVKDLLKYLQYDIIFNKNGIDQFSLPIWLFLIILLFTKGLMVIALIIAVITKHKISIKNKNS
ncbi:MAG: DUF4342 domain-containing protein [Bacillota bacterium]